MRVSTNYRQRNGLQPAHDDVSRKEPNSAGWSLQNGCLLCRFKLVLYRFAAQDLMYELAVSCTTLWVVSSIAQRLHTHSTARACWQAHNQQGSRYSDLL
jgi:hypothetical protein